MTKLNKNNYIALEVLKKICRTLGCDIGDAVSLIPQTESTAASIEALPRDGVFYMKYVALSGDFLRSGGYLKKIVYNAGGAPSDKIRAFTECIVVGEGGDDTKAYKACEKEYINMGHIVTLTPQQLYNIADGRALLPKPNPTYLPWRWRRRNNVC
jgi:hypothetical protein